MADMRFLKQRHRRYWFQMAVPKSLWDHYDGRAILKNLDTANLSEAQARRWFYVAKWRDTIR